MIRCCLESKDYDKVMKYQQALEKLGCWAEISKHPDFGDHYWLVIKGDYEDKMTLRLCLRMMRHFNPEEF
jgi:hypothetical protein